MTFKVNRRTTSALLDFIPGRILRQTEHRSSSPAREFFPPVLLSSTGAAIPAAGCVVGDPLTVTLPATNTCAAWSKRPNEKAIPMENCWEENPARQTGQETTAQDGS